MVRGPICVQLLRIVHMRRARGVPGDVRAARFRVVYRKGERARARERDLGRPRPGRRGTPINMAAENASI